MFSLFLLLTFSQHFLGFAFDSTYDFKQKYPPDAVGEEMAPNARFWRTYNDEAAVSDAEVMEQYRDTIDILLVFVRPMRSF